MTNRPHEVAQLLVAWGNGDQIARDQLMAVVYPELHRLAHNYMKRESAGHTLQTSALVNEAFLRLVDQRNVHWRNRAHFFGIAAQMMRRILVELKLGLGLRFCNSRTITGLGSGLRFLRFFAAKVDTGLIRIARIAGLTPIS
jgi:ECF sigma factor